MINRTKEEVESFVEENWACDYTVRVFDTSQITIKLSSMYSAPGLSFQQLMKLAEFLGTKNIDVGNSGKSRGCDTCDYGSEAWIELIAREE